MTYDTTKMTAVCGHLDVSLSFDLKDYKLEDLGISVLCYDEDEEGVREDTAICGHCWDIYVTPSR